MPQIKIPPYIRSLILVLIFFALGRILFIQMGSQAWWVIGILLVGYYAVNWVIFQRRKKNEK